MRIKMTKMIVIIAIKDGYIGEKRENGKKRIKIRRWEGRVEENEDEK